MSGEARRGPVRSFVSFVVDPAYGPSSDETLRADTRAMAERVVAWLRSRARTCEGPYDYDGRLFEVLATGDGVDVEAIVGYAGDGDIQWMVNLYPSQPVWRRLFGRTAATRRAEAFLEGCAAAIHEGLSADGSISMVRWYRPEEFDRDHGRTWSPSPWDP